MGQVLNGVCPSFFKEKKMITEYAKKKLRSGKRLTTIYCLEADFSLLPTGLANGSELYVLDTANNPKRYDDENDTWYDTTGTEYTGGQ